MTVRVLVTRPQREALRWADDFRARGLNAEVLPLIAIGPADVAPLVEAWRRLPQYHALMFVSANAVQAWFGARPPDGAWPAATRAWATGPGTTRALHLAGIGAGLIDAPALDAPQFDSETLWQIVAPTMRPDARVLIVRGADAGGQIAGRPWLAERLAALGVPVDAVVAYTRGLPDWGPQQRADARAAAQAEAVWLFSSSDAVRHLGLLLPGEDWRSARALATHARIAEAARGLGFGRVAVSRPGLDDMLASIESLA